MNDMDITGSRWLKSSLRPYDGKLSPSSLLLGLSLATVIFCLAPFMISMGKIAVEAPPSTRVDTFKPVPPSAVVHDLSHPRPLKKNLPIAVIYPNMQSQPLSQLPAPSLTLDLKFNPVMQTGLQIKYSATKTATTSMAFTGMPSGVGAQNMPKIYALQEIDLPALPLASFQGKPLYPPAARLRNIEGYVVVQFEVLDDGQLGEVKILDSHPGEIFVDATTTWIKTLRFPGGTRHAQGVKYFIKKKVIFQLE